MKHTSLFLVIFLALLLPFATQAENTATAIDSLIIDFWPDYDRPSALVLLTGALPADTALPATVTLPFPKNAQLNAVARIDGSDGLMKDDISTSLVPGQLTFTTPDLRFRAEYYLPYTAINYQRTFNFTWLADLSVNSVTVRVQRPIAASSLSTVPATTNIFRGEDGFTYHALPAQAIPAGQSFSLQVDYIMASPQLSAESISAAGTGSQESGVSARSGTRAGINWSIVAAFAGGVVIMILLVWQIASRRQSPRRTPADHAKTKRPSALKFCPNCGSPTGKGDKFCSNCGTALRAK